MPSRREIYKHYAVEYDELVNNEDFRSNLSNFLLSNIDFSGKTVIELGAGTGRLTYIYADSAKTIQLYDNSAHMLDKARVNLEQYSDKISFGICDNTEISSLSMQADIVIEGWSFGHVVNDNEDKLNQTIEKMLSECRKLLKPKGKIIIIETLGTNRENPEPTSPNMKMLFEYLENHGFIRHILRTDYRFSSNEEAKRVTGFFFGQSFAEQLEFVEAGVVKEYTGIWIYES